MSALLLRIGKVAVISTAFASTTVVLGQDEPAPAAVPPATAPEATPQPAPQTQPGPVVAPKDLPAAKDIVQKAIDAMGGREALDALKSAITKAEVAGPIGQFTLEMNWMAPNMMLVKQSSANAGGGTVGSDGMVTWAQGPFGYQIIPNEQGKQIQQQASMFRLVQRIEGEHKELKTLDQVKFGDFDCYKVYGKDDDGVESLFFFDVKDHLIRGGEMTQASQMGEMTQTIRFGEWKEGAGIKYFTKLDIEQMGMTITLTINEVTFNTLEAGMFALPDEVKAMLKEKEAAPPAETQPAPAPGTQPAAPKPADNGGL